jgi:hypothetical protein
MLRFDRLFNKPNFLNMCKRFAVQQSHPSMSSRRSNRDPNASSFNLFTGEETSGAPQSTQRTTSQKTASSFNLFTGEEINGPDFAYQQQYQQQQRAPSSNVWASNQSQNCGNMLSERPSTFVSQAPGGRSSFTIGDPDMCASTRARAASPATNTPRRVDDRFSAHSHRSTLQSRENYPAYQEPSYSEHQQCDMLRLPRLMSSCDFRLLQVRRSCQEQPLREQQLVGAQR